MSIFVFYKISTSILHVFKDFDVTFYSFYQGSSRMLQLLKWPCRTSFFYPCGALTLYPDDLLGAKIEFNAYFLILGNHFLMLEVQCLISEIQFLILQIPIVFPNIRK